MTKKLLPSDPLYKQAQANLDLELAKRSPAAAVVFSMVALVFFFGLDLDGLLDLFVKALAAIILIVNFIRTRIGQAVAKEDVLTPQVRRKLYASIYVNSTVWAVLFLTVSAAVSFKDWRIVPVMVGYFAMAVASPFTLSYSRTLLVYFTLSWNIPQILVGFWQWYMGYIEVHSFITFTCYFLIVVMYSFRQGFSYRGQLFEKFINDLELKKATEELLESRQKIIEQTAMTQQANRLSAIGVMAAGVAHEINTPLAVIQIRADNLQDMIKNSSNDMVKFGQEVTKISTMVNRIAKIIQGLRAFARDSAEDPLAPAEVSAILEESLNLCQEKFKNSQIEIRVVNEKNFSFDCVQFQIVQVIVNLLSNSYDAILNLPEKWVEIRAYEHEGFARIEVIDSGSGIPDKIADKIMQPFFTTKEVGSGTGLGLSVSKGIIDKHKGTLEYMALNGNTCFRIEIPIKAK